MRIVIENFKSITSANFVINDGPNLALIDGYSGIGKSTIVNAIIWCLYGCRTLITSRNISAKNNKSIKVSLALPGVYILRQTKPERLEVQINDELYEDEYGQSVINQLFGTYEVFSISSSISQDSLCKFVNMSGNEKYKVMETLFFDKGANIHNRVNKDIRLTNNSLDKFQSELTSTIQLYDKNLTQLPEKYRTKRDKIDVQPLEDRLSNINYDVESTSAKVKILDKELYEGTISNSLREKLKIDIETAESVINELTDKTNSLNEEISSLNVKSSASQLENERNRLLSEIENAKKLRNLTDIRDQISEQKRTLENKLSELPNNTEDLTSLNNEINKLTQELNQIRDKLTQTRDLRPKLQRRNQILSQVDNLKSELNELKFTPIEPIENEYESIRENILELQNKIRFLTRVRRITSKLNNEQLKMLRDIGVNIPELPSINNIHEMEKSLSKYGIDKINGIDKIRLELDSLKRAINKLSSIDPMIMVGSNLTKGKLNDELEIMLTKHKNLTQSILAIEHQIKVNSHNLKCPHCNKELSLKGNKLVPSEYNPQELENRLNELNEQLDRLNNRIDITKANITVMRVLDISTNINEHFRTNEISANTIVDLIDNLKKKHSTLSCKFNNLEIANNHLSKFKFILNGELEFNGEITYRGYKLSEIAKIKDLVDELDSLPSDGELNSIDSLSEELDKLRTKQSTLKDKIEKSRTDNYRIKSIKSTLSQLEDELADIGNVKIEDNIDEVINKLSTMEVIVGDKLTNTKAKLASLDGNHKLRTQCTKQLADCENKLKDITNEINQITINEFNPEDRVKEVELELEKVKQYNKLSSQLELIQERITQREKSLNELKTQLSKTPEVNITKYQSEIDKLNKYINSQKDSIQRINADINESNKHNELVSKYEMLQPQRDHINKLKQDVENISSKLSNLIKLSKAIESTRVKVLTNAFSLLSARATAYTRAMFVGEYDRDIEITILPTKTIKSTQKVKAEVSVIIKYNGIEYTSISAMSGGEGARVSLAILLAINSMLPYNFKIILLDEVLSSLGENHRDATVCCLRDFANSCDATIISILHECDKGLFNQVIRAKKVIN